MPCLGHRAADHVMMRCLLGANIDKGQRAEFLSLAPPNAGPNPVWSPHQPTRVTRSWLYSDGILESALSGLPSRQNRFFAAYSNLMTDKVQRCSNGCHITLQLRTEAILSGRACRARQSGAMNNRSRPVSERRWLFPLRFSHCARPDRAKPWGDLVCALRALSPLEAPPPLPEQDTM